MKTENELGMIVSFYLSKFGEYGLSKLGFRTYKQAFEVVSKSLNVNPNSVKNWRDEFDPFYDTGRKGWYQRKIRASRLKVISAFDNLSEVALRSLVLDIIKPETRAKVQDELVSALKEIKDTYNKKKPRRQVEYVSRGPTGRMAEEFFMSRFKLGLTPFSGVLLDCRDEGIGFDFEVRNQNEHIFIEIKGLAKELGGILFTDKEWKVANEAQNDYFLGVVIEVVTSPRIGFLQNPAVNFFPVYHAYTTINVSWSVNSEQLRKKVELW